LESYKGEDMSIDITYLHIKRTIASNEECFLCTLEDKIESKYMDTYLSELVMDASSRQKIIESRGFCNHHFYKMLIAANKPGSSNGHGLALVNESIVNKLVQDLHKQEIHHVENFHKLVAAENKCPACIHLAEFSKMYAEKVVELLSSDNEEFFKLLNESKGFCTPHFVTLLNMAKESMSIQSQRVIKTLIEVEEKNLHRLSSELAEYIKKQSYEFSEKDRAAVADIVPRSVEKIAGRRGAKPFLLQKPRGGDVHK
jgi:ribosome biogenesis protein Nip4